MSTRIRFRPYGCSYIDASQGRRGGALDMTGVPQIPSDVHARITEHGEHTLTQADIQRCDAAIQAARNEIKRRLLATNQMGPVMAGELEDFDE